ncbi:MAG: tetratricopeptide repeat protein [Gemmatimonadota bacterium]|nr:tetratricopeptide repeat protein [Gemmatimonadota bacterium]
MSSSAQRAALEAIHSARPLVARLGESKNSEDVAADIIEAWTAVEAGLRSLIGGSALSGQMLIRELRQRHFLSLEQANALAEFHAARDRAGRTDYSPTDGDVNAARDAFLKLESGLMGVTPPESRPAAGGGAAPVAGAAAGRSTVPIASVQARGASEPVGTPAATPTATRPRWLLPTLGVIGLLILGGIAWFSLAGRGGSASYEQGVVAYREGRREAAAGAFIKATKDDPTNPMPHVYLARMARETGRFSTASEEAVTAVKLGSTNVAALRELASVSFATQNYESARSFYTRALQVDPTDIPSQGYLGCSLVRLGRVEEGRKWIQRAGPGPWAGCAPAPGQAVPGMQAPGMQGQQPLPAYPR